jgi:sec-independent protein translocase protein TatB
VLNLSPEKVLLLLLIALVVLGPNRLPDAARSMGRLVANLRKLSGTFQSEVSSALAEPSDALKGAVGDLGLDGLRDSLRDVGQVAGALRNPMAAATRSITDSFTTPMAGTAPAAPAAGLPAAAATPPPSAASPAVPADMPSPDDPSLN